MNLNELLLKQRALYPKSDDIDFEQATQGLPEFELPFTIYRTGAAAIQFFRIIRYMVNPRRIVEIGFNLGHSASMMLHLIPDASVLSVEINTHESVKRASEIVARKYQGRFQIVFGSSSDPLVQTNVVMKIQPRLVFIDGDHSIDGIDNDIMFAIRLGAEWIAFDDLLPEFGPGTIPGIAKHNLKVVAATGNMVLCRRPEGYTEQPCH